MNYRQLGKAGIRVSELSLGPWLTFSKHLSVRKAKEMAKLAFDNGINLFDNAERYAEGMAECLMGEVIKCFRRESLVITTKIYWGGTETNDIGLSRKHLLEGAKNSLQRLRLEYVDLLFCHRPDPLTPIEETVLAMDSLVRQGYALYWGTSEWSATQIEQAYRLAEKMNCIPPSMEQAEYNLFERHRIEVEYQNLYTNYGMGLTTWSPLASGILSGKYSHGIPAGSRLEKEKRLIPTNFENKIKQTKMMENIALETNSTCAQLAIAWCLANKNVNSVIIGAANENQLLENLGAVQLQSRLTNEVKQELENIFFAPQNVKEELKVE